jgi:acetyl esterase/lipase
LASPLFLAFIYLAGGLAVADGSTQNKVVPERYFLWEEGSPNNPEGKARPCLEIYRAFSRNPAVSHTVVILPGGGYGGISPYERLQAEFFRSLGLTAVTVDYRVAPCRHPAAYSDACRAIRLIRKNSEKWKIPGRILLLGGSAGGHLAALVATRPNHWQDVADELAKTVPARPDALILLYPVINTSAQSSSINRYLGADASDELRRDIAPAAHVDAETPPTLIFHAADDPAVSVEDSLTFARACWKAKLPTELHVFPSGGHGKDFAYDKDIGPRWRQIVADWIQKLP